MSSNWSGLSPEYCGGTVPVPDCAVGRCRASRAGSSSSRNPELLLSDPLITGDAYPASASEVTRLLDELAAGTTGAANRLASLVYDELRAIAVAAMRREADGHTWQPTELVHEAFSRLMGQQRVAWQNRHHFFGIASQAMRRLLVDHARARAQLKRDGGSSVTLTNGTIANPVSSVDILELNDALDRLAALDPRQVRVVELRFFAGLSVEETAETLDISAATVKRDWTVARAFLRRALSDGRTDDGA